MSRYAGTNDLRDYLSPTDALGTYQNGLLQDILDWTETRIDQYTRRTFVATAGTRYYNKYSSIVRGQALYLPEDLYNLSYLQTAISQEVPMGSVFVEPQNLGPPYRILRLYVSYVWAWNTDQNVIVAGTWGYSLTAPDDIVYATIRWAAYAFGQKDTGPNDVAGFPDAGEVVYPKGMPDDVRGLLSPYRSRSGGVV